MELSIYDQWTLDREGKYVVCHTTCDRIAIFDPDGDFFSQLPGRYTREDFHGNDVKMRILYRLPKGCDYCTVENATWPVLGTNERARRVRESMNEVPDS